MDKITRRDFFKLMGTGTASLWFLPFSTDKLATFSEEPESWPLGKEHFVYSVCDQCPSGCGVVGRVVDGKVKKLDGNPNHPTNRGKLCPIGQAGTQLLYNPDRLREPLRQSGSKGSGRWQTTSWEEAIEAIAKQLRQLRANGQPHHHAILTGEDNSDFSVLLNRFMESFGSPNYFRNIPARALRTAHFLTQGTYTLPAYDLEQANLILSFGAPLLEKWLSPMQSQRAYGYLRQERKGHRAKFIQVESRFSVTAAKADQWVPIRPGTEGALALGIAYVLIKEKLYHKQFVEDETFGFEDWKDDKGQKHRGFKKYALKFYGPERVSEITGISVSSIVKLAKGLSSIRPALVIGGGATSLYSNATHTEMAIHSLNALLGSLEVPGGLTHQQRVNLMPFPKVGLDTIAHNGLTQPVIDSPQKAIFSLPSHDPDMLIESVLTGKPYQIESLWIFDENPVFSSVAADQWREALKKIPLVVNFSTFMTETAEMADFVLPQPTFMERRGLVNAPLVSPFPIVGYMQPIIKPLYNTRDAGEIVLDIAHRIDDNVARKFPWKNFEAFHDKCLENVYKERRGTLFTNFHEEAHVKHLEERGWWMPKHTTFKAFKKEFIKKGGWWDPYHSTRQWGRVFKTSSHKFEFFPQTLADTALNMRLDLESEGMSSREAHQSVLRTFGLTENANGTFLPHYEPIHVNGKTSEFPLFLWLYKPLVFSDSHAANLPWLQEYLVPHIAVRWGSWLEINPETAHKLNLHDRQMVWMESPNGRIKIQIRTYEGTMPDVVSCILGQGHTALGRWAKGAGENPLTLLNWQYDHLAGSPALLSTRVRLYKA